jgi:DNA-binding MarR family transcriptional regulator
MARRSNTRLLVLHWLRLKGHASAAALAESAEIATAEVESWLARLAADGLVVHRDVPEGWALTPAGRAEHARLVGREIDVVGVRPAIEGAYQRFRALNGSVLDACSRWQVREVAGVAVRNDHRDPDYDARVVGDLAALHSRVEPVCDDLAGALERYRPYGDQLSRAVAKVEAGERDWFTKPRLASYHTVWFELHEDLLTTLGLDRTAEAEDAEDGARPVPGKGAS